MLTETRTVGSEADWPTDMQKGGGGGLRSFTKNLLWHGLFIINKNRRQKDPTFPDLQQWAAHIHYCCDRIVTREILLKNRYTAVKYNYFWGERRESCSIFPKNPSLDCFYSWSWLNVIRVPWDKDNSNWPNICNIFVFTEKNNELVFIKYLFMIYNKCPYKIWNCWNKLWVMWKICDFNSFLCFISDDTSVWICVRVIFFGIYTRVSTSVLLQPTVSHSIYLDVFIADCVFSEFLLYVLRVQSNTQTV